MSERGARVGEGLVVLVAFLAVVAAIASYESAKLAVFAEAVKGGTDPLRVTCALESSRTRAHPACEALAR